LISIIVIFVLSPLWNILGNQPNIDYGIDEKGKGFVLVVLLLAPVVESLVFQTAPIAILNTIDLFKDNDKTMSLIAGLLFGLSHMYSLSYFLKTSIVGFFLAFYFIRIYKQYDLKYATISIIVFHALWNLFVWFYRN
jgi:lipoprotein signal peptidase